MKKLNYAHLGHGITFWEEGSNDYQAHIAYTRIVTVYDNNISTESLDKINRMAESGNCIHGNAGSNPHVVLKPLNEAKYIKINPITKQEISFSVETIGGVMYECVENYLFRVEQHPCIIHQSLLLYGEYKRIQVFENYEHKYLLFTYGELFLKIKYQFLPEVSEIRNIYQNILSKKIVLYKLPIKIGEWYQIPTTDTKGEYIGEQYGNLVFKTSSPLEEYIINVKKFLEVEQ